MSYNGSGTFQINTSGQPVVTGTIISSTAFNALTADLATGLSTAITKDGQTATTVRIPFAQGINSTLVTDSTSTSTGSIITAGGVGIAKSLVVGQTTDSTSTTTGSIITAGGVGIAKSLVVGESINSPNTFGFKNRIINGLMTTDQRNAAASQTFTAAAALAYSVDRWYGYCTGANVTGQQVAGSTTPTNTQFRYKFTGAASVTAVGFGQRIEQKNSYDLAGSTCTLSADLAISATLTTVTWTASYATTTADTFGSLASPTVTQIATGTFTVSATVTNFSANISVPAAATTGIQIVFTVGALTAGLTWTIGNVQLEKGSTATSFDFRSYGTELALCQRYYYRQKAVGTSDFFGAGLCTATTTVVAISSFPTTMRTSPTALEQSGTAANYATYTGAGATTTCSAVPQFVVASVWSGTSIFTVASGLTVGHAGILRSNNAAAYLGWSAEL